MYNIFFTSDTHFGHANMCQFINYDGTRVRPFEDFKECDELMIQNWNEVVRPTDKVYFLGDLAFNKNYADKIMPRLNGKKCMIRGNHDLYKLSWYSKWFYDIRGCYNFENYLMTHIPIHPESKARFKMNIHGHLHGNYVMLNEEKDPWYRNVCMDANDYKLIPYEHIQYEFSVFYQQGKIKLPTRRAKKEGER